jgi:hypothetical protein
MQCGGRITLSEVLPSESLIYFSSWGEIPESSSGPAFTTVHQMLNQIRPTAPVKEMFDKHHRNFKEANFQLNNM